MATFIFGTLQSQQEPRQRLMGACLQCFPGGTG